MCMVCESLQDGRVCLSAPPAVRGGKGCAPGLQALRQPRGHKGWAHQQLPKRRWGRRCRLAVGCACLCQCAAAAAAKGGGAEAGAPAAALGTTHQQCLLVLSRRRRLRGARSTADAAADVTPLPNRRSSQSRGSPAARQRRPRSPTPLQCSRLAQGWRRAGGQGGRCQAGAASGSPQGNPGMLLRDELASPRSNATLPRAARDPQRGSHRT